MRFMLWSKTRLHYQIQEYLEWKEKTSKFIAGKDARWLRALARVSAGEGVEDITHNDILRFREAVWRSGTPYAVIDAMRSVRGFLRYFKARKYPCLSPSLIEPK